MKTWMNGLAICEIATWSIVVVGLILDAGHEKPAYIIDGSLILTGIIVAVPIIIMSIYILTMEEPQ